MFTQEEIQHFQTAFVQTDGDSDGFISINEVEPMVKTVTPDVTVKGVAKLIKRLRKMIGKGQIQNENAIAFNTFMHAMTSVSFGKAVAKQAGFMNGEPAPASSAGALVPSDGPVLPPAGPPQLGEEPRISKGMELMHANQGQGFTPEGPPPAPVFQPVPLPPVAPVLPPAHQGFTPQNPAAIPMSQALVPVQYVGPPPPSPMGVTPMGQFVPVQPMDPMNPPPIVDPLGLQMQQKALEQAHRLKAKEDVAVQMAVAMSVSEQEAQHKRAESDEQTALRLALEMSTHDVPDDSELAQKNAALKAMLASRASILLDMPLMLPPVVEEEDSSSDEAEKLQKKLKKKKKKIKDLKKDLKDAESEIDRLAEVQRENEALKEQLQAAEGEIDRLNQQPASDPFAQDALKDLEQKYEDRERDHAQLQQQLGELVGIKEANESLKAAVLAANKRTDEAEGQVQGLNDQIQADQRVAEATIHGLQAELRNAEQATEAHQAAEAEVSRLQNELAGIQQGQEEEFAAISAEMDRLNSELEQSQKVASTLPGIMTQLEDEQAAHIKTKTQLKTLSDAHDAMTEADNELRQEVDQLRVSAVAPEEIAELEKQLEQHETMLDNALRLQTRAELGLQKSMEEAKSEMQKRRECEAMIQKLFDRLSEIPEGVLNSRLSAKRRQSKTSFSRMSSNGVSAKVL